jgi:hypothetical protein
MRLNGQSACRLFGEPATRPAVTKLHTLDALAIEPMRAI